MQVLNDPTLKTLNAQTPPAHGRVVTVHTCDKRVKAVKPDFYKIAYECTD